MYVYACAYVCVHLMSADICVRNMRVAGGGGEGAWLAQRVGVVAPRLSVHVSQRLDRPGVRVLPRLAAAAAGVARRARRAETLRGGTRVVRERQHCSHGLRGVSHRVRARVQREPLALFRSSTHRVTYLDRLCVYDRIESILHWWMCVCVCMCVCLCVCVCVCSIHRGRLVFGTC
jgi:hypothetical protein